MHTYTDLTHQSYQKVTRRRVLKTGFATGLGYGALALTGGPRPRAVEAASQPVSGGQVTVMNYAYPEVWDPHLAAT